MLTRLVVLFDADCGLCRTFRDWLVRQPLLVDVDLIPAGSAEARRRLPDLDHAATLREITVVGDDGAVWTAEQAWVMCLWVTARHRALSERLARPAWLPLARAAACTAAGVRTTTRTSAGGNYIDDCAGACVPAPGQPAVGPG